MTAAHAQPVPAPPDDPLATPEARAPDDTAPTPGDADVDTPVDTGADDSAPAAGARDSDFDSAPEPKDASGILIPRDRCHERWRAVPRTLLYPVRGLWFAVWGVPRLSLWAYDRFQLKDRFYNVFFNDTETVGLYPIFFVETGFGMNGGGRFILRDFLAEDTRLVLRASYGGITRQLASGKLATGKLLGDTFEATLVGQYEIFPKSRFSGIGNGDLEPLQPGAALVDPLADDTAVATRYRHDDYLAELAILAHMTRALTARFSVSYKDRTFYRDADERDEEEIVDVYDTSRLIGFDTGIHNVYSEFELSYDSRRSVKPYLSDATPSTGWHVTGFAGYQGTTKGESLSHARWGLDVQRYVDLYGGDRVLVVRVYAEGVTGPLDEIPFVDLPRLGGKMFLRGYHRDRFRDRYVTMGTVEYSYPIDNRNINAYVFVDAGRVWRELGDISASELEHLRVGFGAGLQGQTLYSFLTRMFVASSIDGGIFFSISFDPVYDARSREDNP